MFVHRNMLRTLQGFLAVNCCEIYLARRLNGTFHSKMLKYILSKNDVINRSTLINIDDKLSEYSNILKKFDTFEIKQPGRLISTNLYKDTIDNVSKNSSSLVKLLDKDELIKLLFYVSLQKKSNSTKKLIHDTMRQLVYHIGKFTLQDTCIVANSAFKTSNRRIGNELINHVTNTMHNNLFEIMQDPAVLVCLTKVHRLVSVFDYDLLHKIALNYEKWATNFTAIAHILVLFAEAKYYNEECLNFLIQTGLNDLHTNKNTKESDRTYFLKRIRAKDLSKFVWAISVLNGNLTSENVQNIIQPQIQHYMENSKGYTKTPDVWLDCALSLCILGVCPEEMIKWVTSPILLQQLLGQNKTQPWVRLKLLNTIVKIEKPNICLEIPQDVPNLPEQTIQEHLQNRAPLQKLLTVATKLSSHFGLQAPTCEFQVPYLHIGGIVICSNANSQNLTFHLELLDKSVCLYNTFLPVGIMRLKLRLMKKKGYNIATITEHQLLTDDTDLYMLIEDLMQYHLKI